MKYSVEARRLLCNLDSNNKASRVRRCSVKKLIFGTMLFMAFIIHPALVSADLQVSIGIGVPPPLPFAVPPEVVVVPSGIGYVYMVPGIVGLYFYQGYWYRYHGGYWYRAVSFSDPWAPVAIALVPAPVVVIPPDYILDMPPAYYRIRYDAFHRSWRDWDRGRYWHGQPWYREHERRHWAGQEFHRLPPGHPGHRGPYEKPSRPGFGGLPGKPEGSSGVVIPEKVPRPRPVHGGPADKGAPAKPAVHGPHEKGPGGKPAPIGPSEKVPRAKPGPVAHPDRSLGSSGEPHDKGPR